jgi:hypothetical protein
LSGKVSEDSELYDAVLATPHVAVLTGTRAFTPVALERLAAEFAHFDSPPIGILVQAIDERSDRVRAGRVRATIGVASDVSERRSTWCR